MSKVLIIGAGGVGGVVTHKCAQHPEVFSEICLASRNEDKCKAIAAQLDRPIQTAQVDADSVEALVALIESFKPDVLIHVALPYQDLTIMEACLKTGVPYLDTANYEHPDEAKFEYKEQWAFHDRYAEAGNMATLGCGFDPGMTNIYCAYAQKNLFDEIHRIDILDANGGDHGYPFATNFNPEINIREITANGRYWEKGEWKETAPLAEKRKFDFDGIGEKDIYLLYHEELESLSQNIKGLERIRFWMTFSEKYITHLKVLENVGMTRIEPIKVGDCEIAPLQFLKAVLPDPASLGPRTKGKTNIGIIADGIKDGKRRKVYIYNICDHEACYREVQSQAISYTTGVPAVTGAMLMLEGIWKGAGVFNVEQLDPDPFMARIGDMGLPWQMVELDPDHDPLA
ncbi:saccharopine dehydrogenase family protein [Halomonas sp. MCCC 1A17488]|uniref:Saccharopine dehydrogenase family protein n=1 Tax=Billgrantia sulfidoxydans TaxID=2733484 RepID=A0ABX7W8V0_9GAMM|nr:MULTISPECIES: saccharopine dehydrogenase family protein [Halomonas]MCE8017458.1 saccharopine dehydrogenase family protein [Halomonas sp. MCCC 1A17488]MCG3240791.1 saccharopine dehydrogenase family protein [Halomonas sp. MCCC 1A17488]QPP49374.1 saccharopine dehydrogenase family protein [Halomonas sp. SS10-MC5]QTP56733.1 saccharopine dehydrogenase family protein [Halomonas sulfidoxydans]